ncbi:MAG: macro domain-containing protein [Lewinellaceae bacterium]|nr:macro domain-containing protein [Lewinellaceae bacterium]
MIKEVTGDILLSDAQVVAHGVAPNDHFNSGLALSLREVFPGMYKDFRQHCHKAHPKPGEAWMWTGGERQIVNLLTQEPPVSENSHPGRASIIHVNHALRELVKLIEKEHIESVALPRLATGVGGLDWEEVRPVIYNYLDGLATKIYLYTHFTKGVKAAE